MRVRRQGHTMSVMVLNADVTGEDRKGKTVTISHASFEAPGSDSITELPIVRT